MNFSVTEPRIERSIELHFQGDWGQANLHRICCWLSQEVNDRAGPDSKVAIWTGRGGADAVRAVIEGKVDVALAVPAPFLAMAVRGVGLFEGTPHPDLRALGTMPQNDRLVVALNKETGITNFAQLRDTKPALTIATSPDDGTNTIGFVAQRLMERAGIPRAALESWGGSYVERERPRDCTAMVMDGSADGIIHEAIMTFYWKELAESVALNFLPIETDVLGAMEEDFGWPGAILPAGYFLGLDDDYQALDFSDFSVIARADMQDDVAYLIAWCMCENRQWLEQSYSHIPPANSPVTYPLDPARISRTSVQLHPGAEAYYRDAGIEIEPWRSPAMAPR